MYYRRCSVHFAGLRMGLTSRTTLYNLCGVTQICKFSNGIDLTVFTNNGKDVFVGNYKKKPHLIIIVTIVRLEHFLSSEGNIPQREY